MRITDIIWKERIIAKLMDKHGLYPSEAEQVLLSRPLVRRISSGHVHGEDVYAAMSRIASGRHLIVFFINKKCGMALPISARDMNPRERRYYEKHRNA